MATIAVNIDPNGSTQGARVVKRNMDDVKEAARGMTREVSAAQTALNLIGRAMAALGITVTIRQLIDLTSAWSDLTARVRNAAGSHEAGMRIMERLQQMARRTYSSLVQTAEGWLANTVSLRELGYTTQQQLDLVETLNNALVISAARGQRATSVMDAWSKAMALGELRGDNLNTIIMSGGRLAEALAASMGVTTNELRKLGAQGKITTDVMFGVTSQLEKLREEADAMPATLADAFVLIGNAVLRATGMFDQANNLSSSFAQNLIVVADNIERVARGLIGLAVLAIPKVLAGIWAITVAVAANPLGLLLVGLSAAVSAALAFNDAQLTVMGTTAQLRDYAAAAWKVISFGIDEVAGWIRAAQRALESFAQSYAWEYTAQRLRELVQLAHFLGNVMIALTLHLPMGVDYVGQAFAAAEQGAKGAAAAFMALTAQETASREAAELHAERTRMFQRWFAEQAEARAQAAAAAAQADAAALKRAQDFNQSLRDQIMQIHMGAEAWELYRNMREAALAPTAGQRWEGTGLALDLHMFQAGAAIQDEINAKIEEITSGVLRGAREVSPRGLFSESDAQAQLELLREIDRQAQETAQNMAEAFGNSGRAIGDALRAVSDQQLRLHTIEMRRAEIEKQYGLEALETKRANVRAAREEAAAQVGFYGDMASAAKGFFEENTSGYRAMALAERAFRAVQLAMSVASMAQGARETIASTAAGAAKIFSQLGVFAFPVVGAMVATLVGLGASLLGGGGSKPNIVTAEQQQAAQGAGSVLGDATAKSASLANALQAAEQYQNRDLEFSSQTVRALRAIDDKMGAVSSVLARQLGVAGGPFDMGALGLGTTGGGGLIGALFGTKTTRDLVDQGIQFVGQTVADIIAGGFAGSTYQDVSTTRTKKLLGITVSSKTSLETISGNLSADLSAQLGRLLGSIREGVLASAAAVGVEGAEAALNSMQVNLGRLSLEGLKGSEIQEALSAVMGKAADDMAASIVPGIAELQKVGEGAFETLVRLARTYEVVDVQLRSIGMTFDAVGVASLGARQRLVDLFGGIESFVEATRAFAEAFLSEAERMTIQRAAVEAEMDRLGLSAIQTKDDFKAAVQSLDLTTAAGAELYAAMLQVAPAFAGVTNYAQKMADSRVAEATNELAAAEQRLADARSVLLRLETDAVSALAGAREQYTAAQDVLFGLEDTALSALTEAERQLADARGALFRMEDDARGALQQAYERERAALDGVRDAARRWADELSGLRRNLTADILGAASPAQNYAASRTAFLGIDARAAGQSQEALERLRDAGGAFLEASKATAASQIDYVRDIALVRQAYAVAEEVAREQITVADQQLAALHAQVDGLISVNESVVSVGQAIWHLREVQAAIGGQRRDADQASLQIAADGLATALAGVDIQRAALAAAQEQIAIAGIQRQSDAVSLSVAVDNLSVARAAVGTQERVLAAVQQQIAEFGLNTQVEAVSLDVARQNLSAALSSVAVQQQALAEARAHAAAVQQASLAGSAGIADVVAGALARIEARLAATAGAAPVSTGPSDAEKIAALNRGDAWALQALLAARSDVAAGAQALLSNPKGAQQLTSLGLPVSLLGAAQAWWRVHGGGIAPFADGGFTGIGGKYDIAGIVHRGEYVMPRETVQNYGVGFMQDVHRGRVANDNAEVVRALHAIEARLTKIEGHAADTSKTSEKTAKSSDDTNMIMKRVTQGGVALRTVDGAEDAA